MTIKSWRTSKCLTIEEHETDQILMMSGDAEEDRTLIKEDATPMLSFKLKGTNTWLSIPVQFVIEINE